MGSGCPQSQPEEYLALANQDNATRQTLLSKSHRLYITTQVEKQLLCGQPSILVNRLHALPKVHVVLHPARP